MHKIILIITFLQPHFEQKSVSMSSGGGSVFSRSGSCRATRPPKSGIGSDVSKSKRSNASAKKSSKKLVVFEFYFKISIGSKRMCALVISSMGLFVSDVLGFVTFIHICIFKYSISFIRFMTNVPASYF